MELIDNKIFIVIDTSDNNSIVKIFNSLLRAKDYIKNHRADTLIVKRFFIE